MGFSRVFMTLSALAALTVAAQAQQSSASSSRLMFDPTGMQDTRKPQPQSTTGQSAQQPQPAAAQPVRQTFTPPQQAGTTSKPAPRPAAQRRPAPGGLSTEPADTTRSADRAVPREQSGPLGRVALPQGTLGYESKTQMQTYDLSDGRRVPGFDNIQRNDSSYFGLSLKLPTAGSPSSPGSSSSFGSSSPFERRDPHGAN